MTQETLITKVQKILNKEFNTDTDIIEFSSPRNDNKHFLLLIVSKKFENMPLLNRHRLVYSLLNPLIDSGEIHALNLKLYDRKPNT